MKKKKFLFEFKLLTVLLALLFSGNIRARSDTLSFLHITDTHIIHNIDFYHPGIADGRRHYSQGIDPLKHFLTTVPEKTNSRFVAITGDMIDFPEAQTADGEMLEFQIEQFSRLIDNCLVPVFMTLGNHDIAAYSWPENRRVSSQKIAGRARAGWIKNVGAFNTGTYYSKVFTVGGKTYRLIFLDNSYNSFSPEENIRTPYIDKPQLHWLEDQLQQSDEDIEILFMHLPISPANREAGPSGELYSVLAKYPSAKLVLAGHNHVNAIREFALPDNNKITQVQTDAFGRNTENWRIIRLTSEQILVSFPGSKKTEISIPVK